MVYNSSNNERDYIFVPRENLIKYRSAKHHKKKGWSKLYYYRNKKRCPITKKNLEHNFVDLYSIREFRTDTFYKDINASKKDNIWDTYKVIKPHLAKDKDIYVPKPTFINKNYKLPPAHNKVRVITRKPNEDLFTLYFD
jgi:hypothetical protein